MGTKLINEITFSQHFQAFKKKYYPERQLFMRVEGRVKFLKFNPEIQMFMTVCLMIFLGWVAVSTVTYLTRDMVMENKINQITDLRAEYQRLDEDYSALSTEVELRTEKLEERQKYLESLIEGNGTPKFENVSGTAIDRPLKSKPIKDKSQAMLIERILGAGTAYADADVPHETSRAQALLKLRQIDLKQQKNAGKLYAISQRKLADIDRMLKNTPVNIDRLVKQYEGDTRGMGGPYFPEEGFSTLFSKDDNSIYIALQDDALRLNIATSALDSFPSGEPAAKYYISSPYGSRIDPFTKRKSSHYGLDMAGWPGTAIQASEKGKVIKAGVSGPYGRMVEIDHGNGFHTRYGHMNKLHVKKGDHVKYGQKIGDMGKTGRATSSHLHYEVWFEGKVVDPLPFIEVAQDVQRIRGNYESK